MHLRRRTVGARPGRVTGRFRERRGECRTIDSRNLSSPQTREYLPGDGVSYVECSAGQGTVSHSHSVNNVDTKEEQADEFTRR